jgi:SAM-dependent methyltransferase
VLVAGCGSGQQPVQLALTHPDASILAIDLSRASLAYGARMAARLGVSTVQFAQADLLEFEPRDAPFRMISCSGVLHHLRDPLAGWRRLRSWLAPGGVMKIGLYSTLARVSVEAARSVIRETGLAPDTAGLRAARRVILALPAAHPARGILAFADFFSLSGFRDLVMHVQERSYTIPELADALATLDLTFLGFQLPQPVQAQFQAEQGSAALLDLAAWERFEQAHPHSFASMYQFWCAPNG